MTRLHGLVEIKEQRANLQARAPMGSGWGRKGKQDTAGVGRVVSKGRCKGRQPIPKPVHIWEPSGPKGRKRWSPCPLPPRLSCSPACPACFRLRAFAPAILSLERSSPDIHTAHFLTALGPVL